MKLRYKIAYEFDYPKNSVMIILSSPYFTEEYRVPNAGNMAAVLGQAIGKFTVLHKHKIQELEDEDIYEEASEKKSSRKADRKAGKTGGKAGKAFG